MLVLSANAGTMCTSLAAVVIVFIRGASHGSDKQEQEQTKEVLRNVEKAKQIDIPNNTDDVRQRLRDNSGNKLLL
jgi:hypothetical protein